MTWATWLLGLVQPIVLRVMTALGIGYISYNGAQGVIVAILENMAGSFGGLASEVTAILSRAGFFLALSIMTGGLVGGVAYWASRKLGVVSQGGNAGSPP